MIHVGHPHITSFRIGIGVGRVKNQGKILLGPDNFIHPHSVPIARFFIRIKFNGTQLNLRVIFFLGLLLLDDTFKGIDIVALKNHHFSPISRKMATTYTASKTPKSPIITLQNYTIILV